METLLLGSVLAGISIGATFRVGLAAPAVVVAFGGLNVALGDFGFLSVLGSDVGLNVGFLIGAAIAGYCPGWPKRAGALEKDQANANSGTGGNPVVGPRPQVS